MTNQEMFIQVFGIVAWQTMIVFNGLADQYREYWTSPYKENAEIFASIKATILDCRDCKEYDGCPCGKDGHESGTSQGYSISECKDFEPKICDRVKFRTIGGWYNSGIIKDMDEESYLIEVDKEDMQIVIPYYIRVLSSCEIISESLVDQESEVQNADSN